jgi:hypothetical protein
MAKYKDEHVFITCAIFDMARIPTPRQRPVKKEGAMCQQAFAATPAKAAITRQTPRKIKLLSFLFLTSGEKTDKL